MFIVNSYALAVIFCFITMMCWGSWGNTQKLAAKSWRYELFYWDYVIGMFLFSLVICFTMGSFGSQGRPFLEDLCQADAGNVWSVILGGVIFNASNILLSASTSIAGMSVAFPLGVGLSLVLGVIINYLGAPKGDPVILFIGVALIACRGGRCSHVVFLQVCGEGDGSWKFRASGRRHAYSLYSHLRIFCRSRAEQLRVQFPGYEVSFHRGACARL